MIQRLIDFSQKYRVVIYARMSDKKQNPRSPDQQIALIKDTLRKLGYQWIVVKIYRDDGISGRYNRKRPGFRQMLADLKSQRVVADFILVDMLDRFGRMKELPKIRSDLEQKSGVLILTAQTNFADPNTTQGRAHGFMETFTAAEEGHTKSHRVLRGKIDAVLQKRWPGGNPPFGFRIRWVMGTMNGNEAPDYPIIEPDEGMRWITRLHFSKVDETGWGTIRLAEFLDNHPDIPDVYKPFCPQTLGSLLDNPIYYGELHWNLTAADIIDDQHVKQPKPDDEIVRVPDYCPGIVERELWERVKRIRDAHRAAHPGRPAEESDGKLIKPLARGIALNYLLSGLLFCGECGVRMTLSSTSSYLAKDGIAKRYAAYICPRRSCGNKVRIPEEWIREQVISALRERLFPFAG